MQYNVGGQKVAHIVFLEAFMQQRALLWGIGLIAVLVIIVGTLFLLNKPALHGAVIEPPIQAAEINLTDFNEKSFTLSSLRGKVVILYFGYTNCPDECPLTMAHLKLAVDILGDQAKAVQVVMITTDPVRDTNEAMKAFLYKFNPDFIGLVGTTDALANVWRDYGVTVENGGETHSNFIYLIDRAGNFRETFLPDSLPADISADLHLLIGE
jgi:protein SCO1/2